MVLIHSIMRLMIRGVMHLFVNTVCFTSLLLFEMICNQFAMHLSMQCSLYWQERKLSKTLILWGQMHLFHYHLTVPNSKMSYSGK
uniref:Uncharacterized protein n=1 Tax=Arundo donax TaxID=35708 RepID=A0A0A8ZTH4_ARUDO